MSVAKGGGKFRELSLSMNACCCQVRPTVDMDFVRVYWATSRKGAEKELGTLFDDVGEELRAAVAATFPELGRVPRFSCKQGETISIILAPGSFC